MDDLGLTTSKSSTAMDQGVGEETYGEAHVVQPETIGNTISQHTTYLVQAKLGEDTYNCRKRYSDFEWLRAAMQACFPGVRIPPLPKKHSAAQGLLAKATTDDPAFIEARRAGLEDYLQHCLLRKELCVDSQILKRFLGADSEESMEVLKKRIDSVSYAARSQKFARIYPDVKEASLPTDDRISACRTFVTTQMVQLRELADGFKQVVDAQEVVTKALSGAQVKLAAISHCEAGTFVSAGVPKEARVELVDGLRQQSKIMQACPAMHYDLLLAATERELLEAGAMQEALDSVDALEQGMQAERERTEIMGINLKKVVDGGEIPSTGTGIGRMLGMAPKRDREERIVEMKADHEQRQKEVQAMEEFHRLANTVLICVEIGRFFNEKVVGHRQATDAFSGRSQKTAESIKTLWEHAGNPDMASGNSFGYPGTATEAAVAELEYE